MNFMIDEGTSENHWQIICIVSDQKCVIHGNSCIISFLMQYFMSWAYNSAKNNNQSLILPLSLRTVLSDLALWRHYN